MTFKDRIKSVVKAFYEDKVQYNYPQGQGSTYYPTMYPWRPISEDAFTNSIYNKIAIDVANIGLKHVTLDKNDNYGGDVDSSLNYILTKSANIDQTAFEFLHEAVLGLFDNEFVALAVTHIKESGQESYNAIAEMRVAKILDWYPRDVQIRCYDDREGVFKDIFVSKDIVAIVRNPFARVMNQPNSLLTRLKNKLNLLDSIDEKIGSGKLDLIIQLPYAIRNNGRKTEAEQRRKNLESQLNGSTYGVAYTDATEKVIQLNRPIENQFLAQITWLTNMVYDQLGITPDVLNGSANEQTQVNYYTNIVEPILNAFALEIERKYLSKRAVNEKNAIMYIRDPFKIITVTSLAEIGDKMIRNEIMTSNELRSVIGLRPSTAKHADELRNPNLNRKDQGNPDGTSTETDPGLTPENDPYQPSQLFQSDDSNQSK